MFICTFRDAGRFHSSRSLDMQSLHHLVRPAMIRAADLDDLAHEVLVVVVGDIRSALTETFKSQPEVKNYGSNSVVLIRTDVDQDVND